MLEIISVSTFAVALALVAKSHKPDFSSLTELRTRIVTVDVQIICGDCAGNDYYPKKTFLGRNGACAQCGGHSYILASNRYSNAQRMMMSRLSEQESAGDDLSQRPGNSRSNLRTTQIAAVNALEGWTLVTEY